MIRVWPAAVLDVARMLAGAALEWRPRGEWAEWLETLLGDAR